MPVVHDPAQGLRAASSDDKRALLRRELKDAETSPALIAYVDDVAAAWVRVGPRPSQPALARSRIVKAERRADR